MSVIDFSHLSAQERLDLIGDLCDSLDPVKVPVSRAWQEELDRREAAYDAGEAVSVPWSTVLADLRQRQR